MLYMINSCLFHLHLRNLISLFKFGFRPQFWNAATDNHLIQQLGTDTASGQIQHLFFMAVLLLSLNSAIGKAILESYKI